MSILYRNEPRVLRSVSLKYRVASSVRRVLSDVRDNWLARNERVLSIAEKVKDLLPGHRGKVRKERN